jgi:hypothetical protein
MRMRPLALTGAAILAAAPTSAAAGWSIPIRVSANDRATYLAASPALVDGQAAIAAWIRRPSGAGAGSGRVQVTERRSREVAWSRPLNLSGPGAARLAVAAGERGAGALAWVRGGRLEGAQRARADDPWRPAAIGTPLGDVIGLAVAVDRSGGATVVWSERRGDRYLIRVAGRPARGGSWTVRPPRLSVPGPDPPALAVGRGSGVLAAWVEDDRVRAARTIDGAFEASAQLSDDPAARPAAALSPAGVALVAWSVALPGGTTVLTASGRERSGPWSEAADVGIGSAPAVAVNDRGDAVVAWGLGTGDGPESIESATRRGPGAWRASTVVSRCGCVLRVGRAAIDARGLATVAWRRNDDARPSVGGAAALDAGARGWQRAVPPRGRTEAAPGVVAGQGEVVAAWAEAGPAGGVFASSLLGAHRTAERPLRLDSSSAPDSIPAGSGRRGDR